MKKNSKNKGLFLDHELLRARLKLRSSESEKKLLKSHPAAKKFFEETKLHPGRLRQYAAKLLTSGALASTLLFSSPIGLPTPANIPVSPTQKSIAIMTTVNLEHELAIFLQSTLPPAGTWQLSSDQEQEVSGKIKELFGLSARAELEGNRLNHDYGRMGAEQHLPRFPGDTAANHGSLIEKGITPGLGGWGYVTDPVIEKYYVAVQTLYLPNWGIDTQKLSKWYRFRKVVVANPKNGKLIVAAIADAGPAQWTGKHFGGSPEVMEYLGINYGQQNHPVILFFLDDPNGKIPLGPVEYNIQKGDSELIGKA